MLRDAQVDRSNLKWFSYGFRNQADIEYLPTNRIVFELQEGRPLSEVHALVPDGVRFESAKYFRYVVAQSPGVDLLALANRIYESGLVEYAHPDFMVEKRRTADPLYSEQYYLNNTISNLGTADVDIDAPEAWNLTTGSSQIRVAVIDDGVEAHEDLENASGDSRVISGYTPQTGGDGRPTWDQRPDGRGGTETAGHGVASAGIVAASHNSVGVRGVAPNVKIVPINIFNGGVGNIETPSEIAAGINWAWDEGNADVLSNSWGYPGGRPTNFDVIVDAIQDARTQGRNGRGSVVIFSAGNFFNGSQATETFFPASVSGVMAVGAVDRNDNLWDYTPSAGNDIDVVAPSGDTQLMGDVRTTDRMGTLGYERSLGDDYTPRFGGTSAAAPQASGVAALILSLEPGLTESEVRQIIESRADDYGSTTWDGHGRLNASEAVTEAFRRAVTPSSLVITNAGQVNVNPVLDWNGNIESGFDHFKVYRCQSYYNSCNWQLIGQTTTSSYTDFGVSIKEKEDADDRHTYYVKAVYTSGLVSYWSNLASVWGVTPFLRTPSAFEADEERPEAFALDDTVPNPTDQFTTVRFALPEAADVTLTVYDILGREVTRPVDTRMSYGVHRVQMDTSDLPSGTYLYRLQAGPFTQTKRMVIVR